MGTPATSEVEPGEGRAPPPAPGGHDDAEQDAHKNVPGVLRDINKLVSDRNANVLGQILATDPHIGYLVMDLDKDVANDVRKAISELSSSIKTRILY